MTARRRAEIPTIWSGSRAVKDDSAGFIFEACLDGLFNTLSVARRLVCGGYNGQSRAVFRQFVELFDATIVLLADEEFFAAFCEHRRTSEDSYALWKRWFRPSELRRRRALIEDSLLSNKDVVRYFRDYSAKNYGWLSESSHVNPYAVMLEAFPRKRAGEWVHESSLGGTVGPAVVGTLRAMSWYLCVSVGLLRKVLVDKQLWLANSRFQNEVRTIHVSSMIYGKLTEIAARGRATASSEL